MIFFFIAGIFIGNLNSSAKTNDVGFGIGNINNFGVIYFLTGGGPNTLDYYKGAGKTDLLVTWLYKLTNDSNDYNLAATIGILIFIISAVFSMITYARAGISKNEEALQ